MFIDKIFLLKNIDFDSSSNFIVNNSKGLHFTNNNNIGEQSFYNHSNIY
jgi:hypothetical protein